MARRQFSINGWALLLLAGMFYAPSHGQDSRPGQPQRENFSRSARLPQNRDYESVLNAARGYLREARYVEACHALQQLLDASDDAFASDESRRVFYGAKFDANRLLAQMPKAGRQAYETQVGDQGQRTFEAALNAGGVAGLLDVLVRYENTRAGEQSLRYVAAYYFDHGQYALAAVALERLLERQARNGQHDARCAAMLFVALNRSGQDSRADEFVQHLASQFGSAAVAIGGRRQPLTEWLASHAKTTGSRQDSAPIAGGPVDTVPAPPYRSDSPAGVLPSSSAVWDIALAMSSNHRDRVDASLSELQQHGVALLPSYVPLIVGETIVFRSLDKLAAAELKTGRILWESNSERQFGRSDVHSAGRIEQITERLVRELQGDSAYRTMSSDGHRLFAVEKQQTADSMRTVIPRQPDDELQVFNRLVAYDLRTGHTNWRSDGSVVAKTHPCRDTSFLGAPCIQFETLYVMGQTGTEVRLFAFDAASGNVNWWLTLAHVDGSPENRIGREEFAACRVVAQNGLLLCPTAAGAIVAVDVLTRTRAWAYRYPHDVPEHSYVLPQSDRHQAAPKWWRGWREATVVVAADTLIMTSPESDQLHALNARSGEPLWNSPRQEGLYVAGVFGDQAIVAEPYAIRALNLKDGSTHWRTVVGPLAGRGCMIDGEYVLPLREGGVAAVRLSDGRSRRTYSGDPERFGNLVCGPRGIVSQSPDGVRLLASLSRAHAAAEQGLARTPANPEAIALVGRMDREAGQFREAADRFRQLLRLEDQAETREALRDTLLTELGQCPHRLDIILPELLALCETEKQRAACDLEAARALVKNGQPVRALEIYLAVSDQDIDMYCRNSEGPERLVRFDRQVQGEIVDLVAGTTGNARENARSLLSTYLEQGLKSAEPSGLRRYVALAKNLPFSPTFSKYSGEEPVIVPDFLMTRMALQELSLHPNPMVAAGATNELARELDDRSYRVDAARLYQRLHDEFAGVQLADGRTGRQVVSEIPSDSLLWPHIGEEGRGEDWPKIEPAQEVREDSNYEIYYFPVPIEAEPGSLLDRIDVYLERTGKTVRFQGDWNNGYWEVELPKSNNPYRHQAILHQGWGVGPVLVLRVGTELIGISPLDDNGEPNAHILWQPIESLGDGMPWAQNWPIVGRQPPIGFGSYQEIYVDSFGRFVAQVGPVSPGFVCCHKQGKIVAIDPVTGETLWERHDIPYAAISAGDDGCVLLMSEFSRTVEVLRPLDGKTIAVRELDHSPQEHLLRHGRFAVRTAKNSANLVLEQVDLASGETVWQREFQQGSLPFEIDLEAVGVISPEGRVECVSLETGNNEWSSQIGRPEILQQVYCTRDQERLYLVLSEPFENPAAAKINQIRQGYRNPMVNGPLYAISRMSGDLLWQTRLRDSAFSLDQPKEAPFLLFFFWKPDATGSTGDDVSKWPVLSTVRCVDKRTGNQFYELADPSRNSVYHALECNVDEKWVDLRLPQKTVRFRYQDPPAVEPLAEPQDPKADQTAVDLSDDLSDDSDGDRNDPSETQP